MFYQFANHTPPFRLQVRVQVRLARRRPVGARKGIWRKALAIGLAGASMLAPVTRKAYARGQAPAKHPQTVQVQQNISPEEAETKRLLNQAWADLAPSQQLKLTREQQAWAKWKNQSVDIDREQATQDRLEYIRMIANGTPPVEAQKSLLKDASNHNKELWSNLTGKQQKDLMPEVNWQLDMADKMNVKWYKRLIIYHHIGVQVSSLLSDAPILSKDPTVSAKTQIEKLQNEIETKWKNLPPETKEAQRKTYMSYLNKINDNMSTAAYIEVLKEISRYLDNVQAEH